MTEYVSGSTESWVNPDLGTLRVSPCVVTINDADMIPLAIGIVGDED